MATAASLVINVAADASKLEAGFAQARAKSKGFAHSTLQDLKGIDRQIGKLNKGILGLSDARSVGNLLGYGAGGMLGGAVGGAAADAAWKAVQNYIDRAEKGAALIVTKLNEAEATGRRLEGIDLVSAHQVRNAQLAVEALRGADDGGVGAAVGMAPVKESLAVGMLEAQAKLAEHAQAMQRAWEAVPAAVRSVVPGGNEFAAAMQKAADMGKDIAKSSRDHAEATARAAELQAQINQRAFKPVVDEAGQGLAWVGGAAEIAKLQLAAADQDRAFRGRAAKVIAEQDRMANMQQRFTDPGGVAALSGGAAFSAEQKAMRMVEAARASKADPEARDAKVIAEKMLKTEQEQLKRLDAVVDELKGNAKLKVAKF